MILLLERAILLGHYRLSQDTDNQTKVFAVITKKKEEVSMQGRIGSFLLISIPCSFKSLLKISFLKYSWFTVLYLIIQSFSIRKDETYSFINYTVKQNGRWLNSVSLKRTGRFLKCGYFLSNQLICPPGFLFWPRFFTCENVKPGFPVK